MATLPDAIRALAVSTELPKGGRGNIIQLEQVDKIAHDHSLFGWQVEATALKMDIYPTRYLRNMDSILPNEQLRLLESSVAQIGLGGLGGTLLEILLRTGIGTIRGADGDRFEESNLNRQALSSTSNMDVPKAIAATNRAQSLNPSVDFHGHDGFLDADSLPAFIEGANVVIDALGGLKTRLTLQQCAAAANIPMVTGALAGWTGYIGVVQPGNIGPADIMGADNAAEEKLGCPAPAVSFFASLMATETVKVLSGQRSDLNSKMLIVDLRALSFEIITL